MPFFSIILESFRLFFTKVKKQFYLIVSVIFLSSVIDVISFTSIIPVIYLINNPLPITENYFLHQIYITLGFASNTYFILFLLIGIALFFIFKNIVLFLSFFYQNKFIFSVAYNLLNQQLSRFYNSDFIEIKNHNTQEYLRYIAIAPLEFSSNILLSILAMLYEVFVIILIVTGLLIYMPVVLLLICISIVPVCYLLIKSSKNKLNDISDLKGKLETETFKSAYEGISGFSDIVLFNKEAKFSSLISDNFKLLFNLKAKENIYQWFPRRIIETLVIVSVCILYAITAVLLDFSTNKLVLILLSFATAAYRLMPSINEILVFMLRIKTSAYVINQLSFFNQEEAHLIHTPLLFNHTIEWKNINFSYEKNKPKNLDNINLTIKKGDFIVIVGESGIGKTTIGKIMTGFIRQDSGTYLIDDNEVVHQNQIKKLLGYVTQDFYLFDKTLLENIAIGENADEVDMDRVNYAINAANLKELVNSFSEGLQYKIGETGTRLSGGQRQRIAIARALYKKSKILILDEITSSLDGENEAEILEAIYTISKKEALTVLLITHRIASLKNYDKLYLMENGKLILQS